MIVIGIDPGTSNVAACALRRNMNARWGFELAELPVLHSLDDLAKWLRDCGLPWLVNSELGKRVVAVESVAWSAHAGEGHGHGSGRILESVGMARMFAAMVHAQLVEVAPATWRKSIAGSGRATKEQVRTVLSKTVNGWPKGVVGLNRSDAMAIAITGGRMCL